MNASSWQSILLAKVPENSMLVASQAVTGGNPEPAAMVYQECINHVVAEARRGLYLAGHVGLAPGWNGVSRAPLAAAAVVSEPGGVAARMVVASAVDSSDHRRGVAEKLLDVLFVAVGLRS